jgi:phosphopantetheinyl transferase
MPDISKKDIHLWLVRECDVNDPVLLETYLTLLSARELARYERLRLIQDKKEFLLTQVLARTVLAQYLIPVIFNLSEIPMANPTCLE